MRVSKQLILRYVSVYIVMIYICALLCSLVSHATNILFFLLIYIYIGTPQELKATIKSKMQARADQLMATYTQIALQFADLHDRPERMLAKKVISKVVNWQNARSVFYWRVKRRVLGMSSIIHSMYV